jgi:hypothetical protein
MGENRRRIVPVAAFNRDRRIELARLLIEAGFAVKEGKEKINGKTVYYVEYWED